MKTLVAFFLFLAAPISAAPPAPDWYYPQWLAEASHAPVFQVRDTVHKYGRYASKPKPITIKDLIKYHGHFCGGLVEGAVIVVTGWSLRIHFSWNRRADTLLYSISAPDTIVSRRRINLCASINVNKPPI